MYSEIKGAGRVGCHRFRAYHENGSVVVVDSKTNQTVSNVKFAATKDLKTCYAYVDGVGFIGGWSGSRRRREFRGLVGSINMGYVYSGLDALPR